MIDHFSYLADGHHGLVLLGFFFAMVAFASALTGQTFYRYGTATRAEDPKKFWSIVAAYCVGAISCFVFQMIRR